MVNSVLKMKVQAVDYYTLIGFKTVHLKDFQPLGMSLGHDNFNLVCN